MRYLNPPPATEYTFLSLGAGVQSSALALMAKHGEVTPMPDAAIFADTGNEPRAVMKYLDYIEPLLPFPIHRVSAGRLSDREIETRRSKKSGHVYRRSAIPMFVKNEDGSKGIVSRKCTADHKITPIIQHCRKIANIKRGQKKVTVTQWIGISWDEIQRMKDSRFPFIQHRWPLLEKRMTRQHCKDWMKAHGYPEPPRSACTFCPFHSDHEWRRVKNGNPEEWQFVQDFEKQIQEIEADLREREDGKGLRATPYLHPSLVPIGEVDLRTDEEKGQLTFDGIWNTIQNECEGMCGI